MPVMLPEKVEAWWRRNVEELPRYRGRDNPMAKRRPLSANLLRLSERTRTRGGARSRRRTARVWRRA